MKLFVFGFGLVFGVLVLGFQVQGSGQRPSGNATSVSMGHLHYRVRDVDANKKFWVALGGEELRTARPQIEGARWASVRLYDVIVVLEEGQPTGGTEGSVLNHVAFRVPSLTQVEAAGLKVARLNGFPGVASVMTPEGERIELFENAATNMTFTQDPGFDDPVARRHNQPLTMPIAFHHIHLYVPDGQVGAAKAWYAKVFAGVPGKRSNYDAVDLPGVNLNFSAAPRSVVPTRGRMLDHIAFDVRNLAAFCQRLAAMDVTLDGPCGKGPPGSGTMLTDPWGTSIELTEGFTGG
jgi:catechol 2,3-dioxygenase-like lactoylglutathione lyase family enzyme